MDEKVMCLRINEGLQELLLESIDYDLAIRALLLLLDMAVNGHYDEGSERYLVECFPNDHPQERLDQLFHHSDLFIVENSRYDWLITHSINHSDEDKVVVVGGMIMFSIKLKE